MESYRYILDLAIIILTGKCSAILCKHFGLPQVVGSLAAGLLVGPAILNLVQPSQLLTELSELGVIVMMFTAGLRTDLRELRKSGRPAFFIALLGILFPLGGGYLLSLLFRGGAGSSLEHLFLGTVFTATSVSISVETLKELGKLSTRSGNAILAGALIDDILGLILLTLITAGTEEGVSLWPVLGKIAAFFITILAAGFLLHRLIQWWMDGAAWDRKRFAVMSLGFCFFSAYMAEAVFGVADIIGAFFAGLIIANTTRAIYVSAQCETLSYLFLSPIFFANVGLQVSLSSMDGAGILMTLSAIALAVASKLAGCALGARLFHYSGSESLRIGAGMVARGEVALIAANKGVASGLLPAAFLGPIILMVAATTVMTPLMLKASYANTRRRDYSDLIYSGLVDGYQQHQDFDAAAQVILDAHNVMLGKRPDGRPKPLPSPAAPQSAGGAADSAARIVNSEEKGKSLTQRG